MAGLPCLVLIVLFHLNLSVSGQFTDKHQRQILLLIFAFSNRDNHIIIWHMYKKTQFCVRGSRLTKAGIKNKTVGAGVAPGANTAGLLCKRIAFDTAPRHRRYTSSWGGRKWRWLHRSMFFCQESFLKIRILFWQTADLKCHEYFVFNLSSCTNGTLFEYSSFKENSLVAVKTYFHCYLSLHEHSELNSHTST